MADVNDIKAALARVNLVNPVLAAKAGEVLGNIETALPKKPKSLTKPKKPKTAAKPASQMKRKPAKKPKADGGQLKNPAAALKKKKKKKVVSGGAGLGGGAPKMEKGDKKDAKGKSKAPAKTAKKKGVAKPASEEAKKKFTKPSGSIPGKADVKGKDGKSVVKKDRNGNPMVDKNAKGKPGAIKVGVKKPEPKIKIDPSKLAKTPLKPIEKQVPRHKKPEYKKAIKAASERAKKIPADKMVKGSSKRKGAANVIRSVPNQRIAKGVDREPEKVNDAIAASVKGAAEGTPPNRLTFRTAGWLIGAAAAAFIGGGLFFLATSMPGVATIAMTTAINYVANAARGIQSSEEFLNGLKEYVAQQVEDGDLIEQLMEELHAQAEGTAEGMEDSETGDEEVSQSPQLTA